ncbi:MAG: type IV pilin protein [Gammaproteobacteria bacterium]|nr:MAG: type IV pilin protein [Gammaproteobacteria bacterium]
MGNEQKGVTLIELMIVVAIIAIIGAVALPSYMSHVQKTRRADGQAKLMEIMALEERHYSLNNTYVVLSGLSAYDSNSVDSDEGNYVITAAACGGGLGSCVQLTATPQGPQADDTECGALTYNSRGQKGEGGTGSVDDCW